MSTATLPRVRPSSRLLTAADLAALPSELDCQAVNYELFDGELIVMDPPSGEHGRRQALISRFLFDAEVQEMGIGFAKVGIVLRRNPDRVPLRLITFL